VPWSDRRRRRTLPASIHRRELHSDASQSEIYRPFVKRVARRPAHFRDHRGALAPKAGGRSVLVDVLMDTFPEIDVELFERLRPNTSLHKPSIDGTYSESSASCWRQRARCRREVEG
jgi:hypothetical protein